MAKNLDTNKNKLSSLSIFFPFLNDEGTVQRQIDMAYSVGREVTDDLEVIAINGGKSRDNTYGKIMEMKQKYPDLVVLDKTDNREGYAVIKYGFLAATKDWVFYTDGDAQYHLEEDLVKLVNKQIQTGADVVNGYKIHRGDNPARTILGNMYKKLSQSFFKLAIRDTDCDFRLIRKASINKITMESTDASILPELIKKLELSGAKFAEVEVSHFHRVWGRSNYTALSLLKEKIIGDFKLYFKMKLIKYMFKSPATADEKSMHLRNNEKFETTHWWFTGIRYESFNILKRYIPAGKNIKILDIGCGTGVNTLELSKYGETEGIDPDKEALELAKKKGLNVHEGTLQNPNCGDKKYDLITLFDVFSQVNKSDHQIILAKLNSMLNPGGMLVMREPAMNMASGKHDVYVNTKMRFNASYLQNLLTNAGYEVRYLGYLNTLLFFPIVLKRKWDLVRENKMSSDVSVHSEAINSLLLNVLKFETFLTGYIKMPFGVSVFVIAVKK